MPHPTTPSRFLSDAAWFCFIRQLLAVASSRVDRLRYNSDVVAFKMGRRQGGPSRTGGKRAHI
jgi:hypothetical protein